MGVGTNPYGRKLQSVDGFLFLPDETSFHFLSAVGESLLKVNVDGKRIQTALNHTQWRRLARVIAFFFF